MIKSLPIDIKCRKCERLVEHREATVPKRSLIGRSYWNKPVPDFGDPKAWLLICGLAPGQHGANRTSRPFQGDKAGVLLYAALYDTGFSNIRDILDYEPGLKLKGVLITNAARCCPPGNKVLPAEFVKCRPYLLQTISTPSVTDILCIGRDAYMQVLKALNLKGPDFKHGLVFNTTKHRIYCSYHTSGYNQSTKRINLEGVVKILVLIKRNRELKSI